MDVADRIRKYMGTKIASIPRGAIVFLVKKVGKTGVILYRGKIYTCPVRVLHKHIPTKEEVDMIVEDIFNTLSKSVRTLADSIGGPEKFMEEIKKARKKVAEKYVGQ